MTSNIGSLIIQERMEHMTDANRDVVIEGTRKEVMALLRKNIRPEFLNRIDEVIVFTPLTKDEIHDIVQLMFNVVRKMLKKNNIDADITEKAVEKLAEIGYDPQFGARPLKRVIQKEVLNELSKMILAGKVSPEEKIVIDFNGKIFEFRNK